MKVVILAAGKGTRMGAVSEHTPKPILEYKGKNLIQHKLEQLPDSIDEIVIVIGYLGEKIVETVGHSFTTSTGVQIPITYVQQNELLGTAHSLWQAKDLLTKQPTSFIVLMGDDLYSKEDMKNMITLYERQNAWVALLQTSEKKMTVGKCVVDEYGRLIDIAEDFKGEIESNLMYTGGCLLTSDVFNLLMVKLEGKEEYGLPQTFIQKMSGKEILALEATYWKRITKPEDLES